MGDFEEKLEQILNNPQAMEQVMALAQSLSGTDFSGASAAGDSKTVSSITNAFPDPQMLSEIMSLINEYNREDDNRIALLSAMRPFVKEKRCSQIDKAIQITKLSRVARTAFELFRTREESTNHV